MLLARGTRGARTRAKRITAAATDANPPSSGRRRAANPHPHVFRMKMRSPWRVASATAVQRNGATAAVAGMRALSRPISAGLKPTSRHQGARKGSKIPTAAKYQK